MAGGLAVSDSAADVNAGLDALQGLGGVVATIALTDGSTPTISVTAASLVADAGALGKITSAYSLDVASGSVTVAQAEAFSLALLGHLAAGLAISDSSGDVEAGIDALQTLGGSIASIALSDNAPVLSLSADPACR